ncbi:MAG TPA: LysR substrate-binding domain-containing protein, partial [Bdellovibrio sp.]|nr:LysR substrate-binding domain-containing protein [Bdellovibrio sp.]
IETIQREEFVLVAGPKFYSENIKGDHSLSRLQRLTIVDYLPHAPVARMWFKHHFNKALTDLDVVYSAESVRGVLKAISLNMGVGVVPAHLLKSESSRFKVISTGKKNLVNQITLALPLSKKLTLTEKTFIEFVKSRA